MRIYDGLDGLAPNDFRNAVVTIGMFDGLHRGHQHVLACLTAQAQQVKGESVVVSFDTHPMAVITGAPPRPILSRPLRLRLLDAHGVDATLLLAFDETMRAMSHESFVRDILVNRIGLRGLVFGYNSNFGFGGQGTPITVRPLAEKHGFTIYEAPAVDVEDRPISSTRIREAIVLGELDGAADMLGRPVSVMGAVVRGDGRGRTLGFPTANIDVGSVVLPPKGVYRVDVEIDGAEHDSVAKYQAVANLGERPTFKETTTGGRPVLEVHIPGASLDLYDRLALVTFHSKIRDEQKFASVDELRAQIERDIRSLSVC